MESIGTGGDDAGKSIVLFSDGTGNGSGKLFKTNVWRTYEAVDLGPPAPGLRKQIAFYDNGVGTSAFKPLAALGGILGFGLKRNVLELYRFACRNYRPGDDIYAFGFSRGAFTIRLVIALIASQGLVAAATEDELLRASEGAYRAYRRKHLPRYLQWPTKLYRWLRGAISRSSYDPATNRQPVIRFVGVWDTVAAYGGPIMEITRAIDNWFFALSMPNYRLSERVQVARHALALDDEREAFQPLVWDEVWEAALVAQGEVQPGRLQQLWFTGMHADVGGGYPDESLSYVSLLWMLEEAGKAGLRTLTAITDRHRALASSAGPIHDSRSGPGVYYRYQPRRLDALREPADPETRVLWEPERAAGLLTAIRVHESVAERIASGTDRYAPITLPARFEIHPPQVEGENAPQRADGEPDDAGDGPATGRVPLLSSAARTALLAPGAATMRAAAMARVWDLVWWRRGVYFASLACTVVLLSMPWWPDYWRVRSVCDDSRCILPGLFSPLQAILPGFTARWIDSYAAQPVVALVAIALLIGLFVAGGRLERRIRARAAAMWAATLGGGSVPEDNGGFARAVRRSGAYIGAIRLLKWYVLPALAGIVLAGALLLAVGAVVTQAWLGWAERSGALCADPRDGTVAWGMPVAFQTADPCTDLRHDVTVGQRYRVTLWVTERWRDLPPWGSTDMTRDAGLRADPQDGVRHPTPPMALAYLQRRVTGARWLEPLLVIRRPDAKGRWFGNELAKVRIDVPDLRRTGKGTYGATFEARATGRLYIGVNDAIVPFRPHTFYGPNRGAAVVEVTPVD